MKKIFLMAYARKNLGDDLFIKMLLERYPMHDFYMKVGKYEYLKELDQHDNLHVMIGNDTDEELYKQDVNEYDMYIYIGGSIFMEGGKVYNLSEKFYNFIERCKENNKPFCYVSCNYGPYQTQEYFELSKKAFKTCTDICFRDKYSYHLFQDIETVRYAPDLAFSYEDKEVEKIPDSIGISIIDLSIRNDLKHKQENYINFLCNHIKKYLEEGKKIYLYSFCENEGDEETLDCILNRLPNNPKVTGIRYNGNLDEFLEQYSKMEYMICARFHAMILSCIARQKMYIMTYSKKIDRVIDDLELNLPVIHFNEIDENFNLSLNHFVEIDEGRIRKIIKDATKQENCIKTLLKK